MRSIWKERVALTGDSQSTYLPKKSASAPLPALIDKILSIRGYSGHERQAQVLSPKLAELGSPFLMLNMHEAATRLVEAFRKQEKICIYADFDLDGTSGCALLKTGLQGLGFKNVIHYQPQRLSEGYGFHASAVEELASQGVRLIVTVDVGITSFSACETARRLGIDVVLTDHHQTLEKLPDAFVIVNPNQPDCRSGLGYLCGAGVAFYLLRACKRYLVDSQLISEVMTEAQEGPFDLRSVLDFLAIATLTDMVPLVADNRVLTKVGLLELERTKKPGLRALLDELDLSQRPLTSQDVAIRFAPKLNALSRMETGLRPLDIYLIQDLQKARQLIGEVLENNQNRVQLQNEGENLALQMLADWDEDKFVCLIHPSFHRGIVGLIATKIASQTGLPTFIGSVSSEGPVVGSGRLPPGSEDNLVLALERAQSVLQRFGGHPQAAGFELSSSGHFLQLKQCLKSYFDESLQERKPRETEYDAEVSADEVSETMLKWFDSIGPFGQSFQVPVLRVQNLLVDSKRVLKGDHLKFVLKSRESDKTFESLWFSPPKTQVIEVGDEVQVLVELQWNYFGGRPKMQLLIREMKKQYDS